MDVLHPLFCGSRDNFAAKVWLVLETIVENLPNVSESVSCFARFGFLFFFFFFLLPFCLTFPVFFSLVSSLFSSSLRIGTSRWDTTLSPQIVVLLLIAPRLEFESQVQRPNG
jgi:asparagine N-glycosylation enzyme membrane subunit Stt3